MNYKYNEPEFLKKVSNHIDSTYNTHYGNDGIQVTEYFMSHASNLDPLKYSVIQYIMRYGQKDGYNIRDLYKAVHYIAMMAKYTP